MERGRFTLTFFVKKRRTNQAGLAPIFIRITLNGVRVEISLNQSTLPEDWDQKQQKSIRRTQAAHAINELIEQSRAKIIDCRSQLIREGQSVTASKIREKYLGRDSSHLKVIQIYDMYLDKIKHRVGIDMAQRTFTSYNLCKRQLAEYIVMAYKKKDIPLDEVNFGFLSNWEQYMRTEKEFGHNTAMKRLKTFRTIIKWADDNEWMKKDPFKQIRIRIKPVDRGYLTQDEVISIRHKELHNARLEEVRDVFLFCCYTSLPYSDVTSLHKEHLETRPDGSIWIMKHRCKTNKMLSIPLIQPAIELLVKYKYTDLELTDTLLPQKSNQKMNAYLKEIAVLCNIQKSLSTHLARHTFATLALLNGMSMEVVSKILGHSSLDITKIYARIVNDKVKDEMSKLSGDFFGDTNQPPDDSESHGHLRIVS